MQRRRLDREDALLVVRRREQLHRHFAALFAPRSVCVADDWCRNGVRLLPSAERVVESEPAWHSVSNRAMERVSDDQGRSARSLCASTCARPSGASTARTVHESARAVGSSGAAYRVSSSAVRRSTHRPRRPCPLEADQTRPRRSRADARCRGTPTAPSRSRRRAARSSPT